MTTIKQEIEIFAAACRRCRAEGRPLPVWRGRSLLGAELSGANLSSADLSGADLGGADLRSADLRSAYLRDAYLRDAYLRGANLSSADLSGADLSGADLGGADLSGADLRGAYLSGDIVAEGTVSAHAAGQDGGYPWHALRLQDGVVVLQYGCERHLLPVWQARGPEYGARHGHDEAHWAIGPAVAIAAAESLITTPASPDAKENA